MMMDLIIYVITQKGEQNANEVLEKEETIFEDLRQQVKVANDRYQKERPGHEPYTISNLKHNDWFSLSHQAYSGPDWWG